MRGTPTTTWTTKGQVTDLNQIGLLLTTPLNNQWHLYGGYYQELGQNLVKADRQGWA